MQQMKEHLDKTYQGLLPNPLDIETNRKNLCNQIQNLMVYKSDIIPSRSSFEKIIIDRINNLCPILKISNDIEKEIIFMEVNSFLIKFLIIFRMVNLQ